MRGIEHIRVFGAIIYTVFIVSAFVMDCAFLYLVEIPPSQEKYAILLLGALISEVARAGSYWTGSTASSQGKDNTIATIAANKQAP